MKLNNTESIQQIAGAITIVIIIINEYFDESMSCLNEVCMYRLPVANLASSIPLATPTSLIDSKQGQLTNSTINV